MPAAKERHLFYSELARLLQAGFPIGRAADALLKQNPSASRRWILTTLQAGLAQGKNIADSMHGAIGEMEFALISAAEQGGRLADGCAHLADYFGLLDQTAQKIWPKMIYPALLLHLMFLPGAAPLLFSEGMMAFLKGYFGPLLCLYAFAAVLFVVALWLRRRARTNMRLDRALNAIPVLGRVRRSLALSRFAMAFEISLLAGRKIDTSLELAASASRSPVIGDAVRIITPQIAAGHELGPLVQSSPAFPADLSSALATAEQAGSLDVEAGRWARYLQSEASRAADVLGEWAPRAFYFIVVIAIAWRILSFYLGYFQGIQNMMNQ